jgi:hypothetical protein
MPEDVSDWNADEPTEILEDPAADGYQHLSWPKTFRPTPALVPTLLPVLPLFVLYAMADRFDVASGRIFAVLAIQQHQSFRSLSPNDQIKLSEELRVPQWVLPPFLSYVRRHRDSMGTILKPGIYVVDTWGMPMYFQICSIRDTIFTHLRSLAHDCPAVVDENTCLVRSQASRCTKIWLYLTSIFNTAPRESPCQAIWTTIWRELAVKPLMDDTSVPWPTGHTIQGALQRAAAVSLCAVCYMNFEQVVIHDRLLTARQDFLEEAGFKFVVDTLLS